MYQAADAVTVMEGGYRVVVAGAGPYLGETHKIKIERVGRLEAHAVLLDATPITEEEMIAMVDPRSDVHEPPRLVGERIDLEAKKRKGKRSRTPSATIDTPTGDMTASVGEETEPLDKPVEPEIVEEAVLLDEDGNPVVKPKRPRSRRKPAAERAATAEGDASVDADGESDEDGDEEDGETTADGAPRKRRRRGRRGGARRRTGTGEAGEATTDEGAADAVAADAGEASTEAAPADGDAPARPKRRRSRGGRGRSSSSRSAAGASTEGGESAQGDGASGTEPKPRAPRVPRAPRADTPATEGSPAAEKPADAPKPKAPAKKKKGLLGRILGKDE